MQRAEGEAWDLEGDLRDVQIYLNWTFRDVGWIRSRWIGTTAPAMAKSPTW